MSNRRGEVTIDNINCINTAGLGVLFIPDIDGQGAIISSWERLPNGKFGPVQKVCPRYS